MDATYGAYVAAENNTFNNTNYNSNSNNTSNSNNMRKLTIIFPLHFLLFMRLRISFLATT